MSSSWLITHAPWQAAGWTMLHFLWIGVVFAIVVAIIEQAVKRCSPETRYLVAVANLFTLALIPVCLFAWKLSQTPEQLDKSPHLPHSAMTWNEAPANNVIHSIIDTADLTNTSKREDTALGINDVPPSTPTDSTKPSQPVSSTDSRPTDSSRSRSATVVLAYVGTTAATWLMNILPWVWVIGFPLTCCTLLIGISGAERFRRRCQILDSTHPAVAICRQLQKSLGLSKHVLLGVTDHISMPILVGIFQPLILFPATTLGGLSAEQLEMILLHELAHVRRWDNLINLVQRVIEAVLFFHPVVWRLSNRVRLEREHCCDATVLAHIPAPQNYAEMLVQMAFTNSPSSWVLGTSISHQLIPRIRRILNQEEDRMQVSRKMIVASLSVFVSLAIATVVYGQRDPADAKDQPTVTAVETKSESPPPKDQAESSPKPEVRRADPPQIQEPLDPKQRAQVISIQGTVYEADGQPAKGSDVWLAGMTDLPGSRYGAAQVAYVKADDNGKFALWHPRWRDTNAQSDEHMALWVLARTREGVITSNVLLNLTGEYRDKIDVRELELNALPQADYSGRVVNANGQPIANAKIRPRVLVLPPTAKEQIVTMAITDVLQAEYSAITDADGKFTLNGLPVSKNIMAEISATEFAEREVSWSTASTPEIRLELPGTIRGRITNLPAKDFCKDVGLLIMTNREGPFDQPQPKFSFNKEFQPQLDGTFELSEIPPGKYQVVIVPKHTDNPLPDHFGIGMNCEVTSGQVTGDIELGLPDVITGLGRIVDSLSGDPIAGVGILFTKQEANSRRNYGSAKTDANGEYVAYLQPGKFVIQPWGVPDGYLPPEDERGNFFNKYPAVEYTKDFEAPTFKLKRAMAYRGTVVDDAGHPVPEAEVRWIQTGNFHSTRKTVTTDEAGRFELPQIDPEDSLPIRVRSPQGVSTAIVLSESDLVTPQPIVVSPNNVFRVKGTLTSQRGKPIANAAVAVHWHRRYGSKKTRMASLSSEIEKLQTNEKGQFESSAFWATDEYHVAVEAKGYSKTDLALVKGVAGQTHDYGTVQLTATELSITGKVIDANGKPLPQVQVFNSGDAAEVISTTTGEDGRFQLSGLRDGSVYLFAKHPDYRFAGTYASDTSQEVLLTLISKSAAPFQRPVVDFQALDKIRQQTAEQMAGWVKEKNLNFRPNLRDNKFNAMARTNPDEALIQIGKQSKKMEERSALEIARHLTPQQPRKKDASNSDAQDTKTALRFLEIAAQRIAESDVDWRISLNADIGMMYLRLGETERGKAMVEAAAKELAEGKARSQTLALNVAQGLAWYDIPRAMSYQDKVEESYLKLHVRRRVIVEVSRYNVPLALELLKDQRYQLEKPEKSWQEDGVKFDLAYRIGAAEPQIAADLVSSIANSRQKAEASGWTAVAVAEANPALAISLIDQGIESLQAHRAPNPSAFYYEYVPAVAAKLAEQAAQINYPDMESLIQSVLALRIPANPGTTSSSRLQSSVNAALFLAFVDPAIAKRMLTDLEPEVRGLLGHGGSGHVGINQWLYAWVLADPEHAAELLKAELEKPHENGELPSELNSAYTLLWLSRPEQQAYIREYGNAGVSNPSMD